MTNIVPCGPRPSALSVRAGSLVGPPQGKERARSNVHAIDDRPRHVRGNGIAIPGEAGATQHHPLHAPSSTRRAAGIGARCRQCSRW